MSPSPKIRLGFVLRGAIAAIAAVVLLLPTGAGAIFIVGLTAPVCVGGVDPSAYGLPVDSEVLIPAAAFDQPLQGYFFPAQGIAVNAAANGTIIAVPTGAARRGDRISEFQAFVRGGYNVLAYESRTCAAGTINSLGYQEVEQVGDALAYLRARGGIDMTRVGIHGFSAGGATAIMAAARYPDVAAVVSQGGYHDMWDEIALNTAAWDARLPLIGTLFRLGVRGGYRVATGDSIDTLKPVAVIGSIAPRPVLLIYGTEEPGLRGALIMAGDDPAVNNHVQLWQVPGAHHGDYTAVIGLEAYAERVNAFWGETLGAKL
ncbi:MAG: prolyl oligopeptidase family serine peptidase [bacterium]|nr:prolyl oligopeptidase family serine peptidase [bacterium]